MSQEIEVPADGSADLGWEIDGPALAPAIVLIHGTRLTRTSWRAVTEHLAGEFRVIAVDLPGHGARSAESFSLSGAADAVAAAIDEVAGGPALVVGHSLGGYVAIELAARWPDRVRGLVLSGASQEPIGPWSLPYRLYGWILGSVHVRVLDAINTAYIRFRYPAHIAEPIVASGYWTRGGLAAVRSIVGERFLPRLDAFRGPLLIVNGEYDVIFRMGERSFQRSVPGGRRRVIKGATHLANLEQPQAFAAAVADFAKSLERRD